MAGAGFGSRPCAARTVPVPMATADTVTSSMPRTSRAATVPTTSISASCPPTSWKWTSAPDAVEGRLDLGQAFEDGERPSGDPTGQRGRLEQGHDVAVGAAGTVVAVPLDDGPGGRHAAPQHRLDGQAPSVHGSRRRSGQDLAEVGAGVEQAAERHVPGDAREAVEPRHRARVRGAAGRTGDVGVAQRRSRAMAQAAPKPLSMPTTVTPAAHEASMASSAVTPSRLAP